MSEAPVLVVDGLTAEFRIEGSWYPAVRDVSFALGRDETLALVGESGCGKSITALSIMGLVPPANGRIASGRVLLDGRDLVRLDE
ncbi:MAG: ATP-binding cassette domain-containing protein, partial [Roseiarcus sp.]